MYRSSPRRRQAGGSPRWSGCGKAVRVPQKPSHIAARRRRRTGANRAARRSPRPGRAAARRRRPVFPAMRHRLPARARPRGRCSLRTGMSAPAGSGRRCSRRAPDGMQRTECNRGQDQCVGRISRQHAQCSRACAFRVQEAVPPVCRALESRRVRLPARCSSARKSAMIGAHSRALVSRKR